MNKQSHNKLILLFLLWIQQILGHKLNVNEQQNYCSLTIFQYFDNDSCYYDPLTDWNYALPQDIDLYAYKNYPKDFANHTSILPIDLDSENYLIGKKLGNGKFSDVYIGYDKKDNYKKVVIKILRPNKIEKIQREISILQKVNSLDNIAHLLGVAVDKEYKVPSLVFEYMAGKTLKHQIERLNERDVRYYSYLLLEVIDQSHKLGILHRDIKAANIIVNHEQRKLKLIDWGLSEIYYPDNQTYSKVGTIAYKAPEILLQEGLTINFTPAVDIWSAGICIIGMMYDRVPLLNGESTVHTMMDIIELFGYKDIFKLSSYYGIDLNPKIHLAIQTNTKRYTPNGKSLKALLREGQEKYAHPQGVDLLNKMLKILPSERISAQEAMNHPYFDSVREIIKNERKNVSASAK